MPDTFWFNRMVEYWSIPLHLDLPDLVRRGRIQMVQAGTFGPQFYSLADDPDTDRRWVGMPLLGVHENLALAADLIPKIQDAGAHFIGQMSMSWHYGDHKTGKGLFGAWDHLWTDDLLGPAPCADPIIAQEQVADGTVRCWPIEGRPYRAYCGCLSNPHWVATLKPMVKNAIALGMDGIMVHHNFSAFCKCGYCRDHGLARLRETFDEADLRTLFGTQRLDDVEDVFTPNPDVPEDMKRRFDLAVQRWTHDRRKDVFDDIYIRYGRSLKPDLMVAQWYHKYNFKPADERSLLPSGRWAQDEDYIWYSQGSHKGFSVLRSGHLADMGLPARFVYATGGGRPFIINKYDYRRFRLSIAEAGANHAAGPAYHWEPQETSPDIPEEYIAPLVRYHRFLADHESLIHPASPWSQAALVYPRRAETAGEGDATNALRRIGRLLEDEHLQFEIILDEHLLDRAQDFPALILPGVRRLSREEGASVRRFVEDGGKLVLTGDAGVLQLDGQPHRTPLFEDWRAAPPDGQWSVTLSVGCGRVLYIPTAPWKPEQVEARPGVTLPAYPLRNQDLFGQAFLIDLEELLDEYLLRTDVPWFVRVRAWRPAGQEAIVLHWVNYRQDEDAAVETPVPVGPCRVDFAIPPGYEVDRVEWRYPEMRALAVLPHEMVEGRVQFTIPGVIVYGLSVVRLKSA